MYFFATTAKGVEGVLAEELRGMGIAEIQPASGGVRFAGNMRECYRANLWLRTASRILMPLAEFVCESPESLYIGVRTIPWADYLTPRMTLAVECNLRDSSLTHSGFVALKTKDAIVDAVRDKCGDRPNVNPKDPDLRVNVHLARNVCTISLDTSGAPLDRRGYRLEKNEAPLRETLAAAIVELTGWDGNSPFVDPMCGSGTLVIEAALKAARRAPGLARARFGFSRWPGYDGNLWGSLLEEARELALASIPVPIWGCDISSRTAAMATQNCTRAGVAGIVSITSGDISTFTAPVGPGIAVINPPYGQRLGDEADLQELYRKTGDAMKQRLKGYTVYLLTGNPGLAKFVGLKASRRIVLFNGPIECRLLKYEMY